MAKDAACPTIQNAYINDVNNPIAVRDYIGDPTQSGTNHSPLTPNPDQPEDPFPSTPSTKTRESPPEGKAFEADLSPSVASPDASLPDSPKDARELIQLWTLKGITIKAPRGIGPALSTGGEPFNDLPSPNVYHLRSYQSKCRPSRCCGGK